MEEKLYLYVNEVTVEFALGINYIHTMQLISSLSSQYIVKRLNSVADCNVDKYLCATSLCFREFFLFLMLALQHLGSHGVGRTRNS